MSVSTSTRSAGISKPVSESMRNLTYEFGMSKCPSCIRTCQCQSVQGQYPMPYQIPRMNQDAAVNDRVTRFTRRVARHIQPKRLKRMSAE